MNAPDLAALRLTSFSHGGGCGCKIAPAVLSQIIAKSGTGMLPKELLVGIETADDAAVWQINEHQAVVATTDFFMPIVDDPFDFGAIAATNAISDVYAMGGTPLFALALVGMPIDKLPVDTIRRILEGGESICAKAGIPIAGGHTIDSVEPIYGLVAIGLVDPKNLKRNAGAQAGRRAGAGQADRRRRLQRGAEEGTAFGRRLRGNDRVDDQAQHARNSAGTDAGRPRADGRHRLRAARAPARDLSRQQRRGDAGLRPPAAARRRAGTRARGILHRRLRAQLGGVRQGRRAARRTSRRRSRRC